jgi:hypothetical protein
MPSAPRAVAPAPDLRIERRVAARRMSFSLTPASLVLVRGSLTLRSAKSISGATRDAPGRRSGETVKGGAAARVDKLTVISTAGRRVDGGRGRA